MEDYGHKIFILTFTYGVGSYYEIKLCTYVEGFFIIRYCN